MAQIPEEFLAVENDLAAFRKKLLHEAAMALTEHVNRLTATSVRLQSEPPSSERRVRAAAELAHAEQVLASTKDALAIHTKPGRPIKAGDGLVSITVLDEEGRPVRGAKVRITGKDVDVIAEGAFSVASTPIKRPSGADLPLMVEVLDASDHVIGTSEGFLPASDNLLTLEVRIAHKTKRAAPRKKSPVA